MLQKCVIAEEIIFSDHFGEQRSDHLWSPTPSSTLMSWGKSLIPFMPISFVFLKKYYESVFENIVGQQKGECFGLGNNLKIF